MSRPVVHVHGELDLDKEIVTILRDEAAETLLTLDDLTRIGRALALSNDPIEQLDSEAIQIARTWVWHATDLLFLGFGFDPRNLKRIGISESSPEWTGRPRRLASTGFFDDRQQMDAAARHCACPIDVFQTTVPLESILRDFVRGTPSEWPKPTTVNPSN